MARKKHAEPPEEHADETWLVPYSDILTLLLALFIVLFASSQVDQKKLSQMAASFGVAFGGNSAVLQQNMQSVPQIQDDFTSKQPKSPTGVEGQFSNDQDKSVLEMVQLSKVQKQLQEYITQNNLNGIELVLTDQGLIIRIKESALFPSGSAEMIQESKAFAIETSKMLASLSQNIIISGHTDNVPINTAAFPTNWDLSSKRALNFMKFLLAQDNSLKPARFSAVGYGEYRPLLDNDTVQGRAQNRRVEVLIMRNYH